MGAWRTDPTFAMCQALTDGADPSSFVGGLFDVRAVVAEMRPVRTGKGVVSGMCANDMRAAAALAVPFLTRIAADCRHPYRADALAEVPSPARARYFGVASRGELLLHRADPTYDELYDDYGVGSGRSADRAEWPTFAAHDQLSLNVTAPGTLWLHKSNVLELGQGPALSSRPLERRPVPAPARRRQLQQLSARLIRRRPGSTSWRPTYRPAVNARSTKAG
ncbi:hypothetical protein ABZX77_46985 [Streptomyces sp. NPDC004237]|uniref:hypothetical protein n=1 Tax=Streptomyces sp. NPDC004237 TaxID=3154455 RepID=UPI00339DD5E7